MLFCGPILNWLMYAEVVTLMLKQILSSIFNSGVLWETYSYIKIQWNDDYPFVNLGYKWCILIQFLVAKLATTLPVYIGYNKVCALIFLNKLFIDPTNGIETDKRHVQTFFEKNLMKVTFLLMSKTLPHYQ